MLKKIILGIMLVFLVGCSKNVENMTFEEIIKDSIEESINMSNVNAIGYKYYLPINFTLYKDDKFNQTFLSNNSFYYMNVDFVSYHYKSNMSSERNINDYYYYNFNYNGKNGYLKITKNNDYFFVEMCYNYAIIEVEVEEKDLKYAISRSIIILNSIKYNDLVIEKYIVDTDMETVENVYKIPEPKDKNSNKNVLEWIKENDD